MGENKGFVSTTNGTYSLHDYDFCQMLIARFNHL